MCVCAFVIRERARKRSCACLCTCMRASAWTCACDTTLLVDAYARSTPTVVAPRAALRPSGALQLAPFAARMILIGDQFNRRGRSCLRFAYSMNGFHVGDLRVYEKGSAGKVYKWVLYGDQGQDWHSAAVDFNMDSVSEVRHRAPAGAHSGATATRASGTPGLHWPPILVLFITICGRVHVCL